MLPPTNVHADVHANVHALNVVYAILWLLSLKTKAVLQVSAKNREERRCRSKKFSTG